jgi:hypothetical protein
MQRLDGCHLLFRRFPDFSINAGRSFAGVFRHSPHGKGFAAQRAGSETLQGFHLTPFLFLSRLRDTSLEPTNIPFCLPPVDLVPGERSVSGRTNRGV